MSEYRSQILKQKEVDATQQNQKYIQYGGYQRNSNFAKKNTAIVELTAFNPNELTKEKAISLGLSEKVGSNIANYLKKGGQFRKTTDFKKIYGLSEADYERLKPYIVLPKKEFNKKEESKYEAKQTNDVVVELFEFNPNELTQEMAMRLGLSRKVGNNIANYLKKGGQFRKTTDFKKIYGLSEADYERLKPYIVLPKNNFNKKEEKPYRKRKTNDMVAELFEFDPNTISVEDAQRLGLSSSLAKRLEKYRQKGGEFRKAADFKKLYGLKTADYERLEPYIRIEKTTASRNETEKMWATKKPNYKKEWENVKININEADAEEWKKLKGIGDSFSSRIVKYRADLGGFLSKEQLKEVYGLDADLYAKIAPHLLPVEAGTVQAKLNINAATAEMLWKHPYITPSIAKGIVQYRKQHGKFKEMEELKKLYLIDDELYVKIMPYFRID